MKACVVALVLLVTLNYAAAFWNPCTGGHLAPIHVDSPQCGATLCTVQRGHSLVAEATWVAAGNHAELNVTFIAFILGLPVTLPLAPGTGNACTQLRNGATCPLVAGTTYTWDLNAPVPSATPLLSNARVQGNF